MLTDTMTEGFEPLSKQLQKFVDDNKTGGISCLVYHKDKIIFSKNFGWKDKNKHIPLSYDTIFRIYSMTKPIVCLGLLTLLDEGKFQLDDPISNYLPEFASVRVLKEYDKDTGEIELVDLTAPITIRQLFTHTAGLTYGLLPVIPAEQFFIKKFDLNITKPLDVLLQIVNAPPLDQWLKDFTTVPLLAQPGSYFWYSHAIDVLGLLIEKLSGQKLDDFLKERLFVPLGMTDTDFYLPEDKWDRLAKAFSLGADAELVQLAGAVDENFKQKPNFLSGGGGLVSTLEDYMKFTQMVLHGGLYDGKQIVSSKIIDLMAQNHFPEGKTFMEMSLIPITDPALVKLNTGFGFGLGVETKIAKNYVSCGIGTHEWGGAMNTLYWIDPKNQLFTVLMTQYCPSDLNWMPFTEHSFIKQLVYDALEDSQKDLL